MANCLAGSLAATVDASRTSLATSLYLFKKSIERSDAGGWPLRNGVLGDRDDKTGSELPIPGNGSPENKYHGVGMTILFSDLLAPVLPD